MGLAQDRGDVPGVAPPDSFDGAVEIGPFHPKPTANEFARATRPVLQACSNGMHGLEPGPKKTSGRAGCPSGRVSSDLVTIRPDQRRPNRLTTASWPLSKPAYGVPT
jgi:hypothetical protein